MKERIAEILKEVRPDFNFESSSDFIGDGYLDSFDIMSLVTELEDAFGIMIDPNDVIADNFANLDTIEKLVNSCEVRK